MSRWRKKKRLRAVIIALILTSIVQWSWTSARFIPPEVLLPVCTAAVYGGIVLGNWARGDANRFWWTTVAEFVGVYAFWGLGIGFHFAYRYDPNFVSVFACVTLYFSAWLMWFGRDHHRRIAGAYQTLGLVYLWVAAYTSYL